jgi:hypothetical protein
MKLKENVMESWVKELLQWLAIGYLIIMAVSAIYNLTPLGRDETDKPGWGGGRSGVRLVIDHDLGCQYLETMGGGITPRLDSEGKQINNKKPNKDGRSSSRNTQNHSQTLWLN